MRAPLSLGLVAALAMFSASAAAQDTPRDKPEDHAHLYADDPTAMRLVAGRLTIEPVVLMQVQASPYVGDDARITTGDDAERAGFRMRRARVGLAGELVARWANSENKAHYPFAITAELQSVNSDGTTAPTVHDAWMGFEPCSGFGAYVGYEDVPFSRYAMTNAGEGALIERPFAIDALAPFHQLGAHVEAHLFDQKLHAYVGLYNAFQRSDQFFLGYLEDPAPLGNRFDGMSGVVRLETTPLGDVGPAIEDLEKGKPRLAIGAAGFLSNGGTKETIGTTGDALLHAYGLHVVVSAIVNRVVPKDDPTQPTTDITKITSFGLVGEAGYMILKRRLGVSGRVELVNANTSVADEQDGWVLAGDVSYHVRRDNLMKLNLDFTHREELHGASLKNDTLTLQAQLDLGARRSTAATPR